MEGNISSRKTYYYLRKRKAEKEKGFFFEKENAFFLFREEKQKRKRSEILFCRGEENGEGKGRHFLEMENIFLFLEKKGKGGKFLD